MSGSSDIRVIDLTHVIAGPFCTYQLAVMGADVIKVEVPDRPDMVRAKTAEFPDGELGLAPNFIAQNANKRSIAIDLKSEQGKAILLKMLRDADVLVENYRSGAMHQLGLGYDHIKDINPGIVYCSMTGFGQTGPKGGHTAYDNVIQAFSGLMASNGDDQTSPIKVGPPILDYGTGIQAAFAIVCALYARKNTGMGQYIDIAMVDAAMMLMSSNITYFQQNNQLLPLTGNWSYSNAGYACYETADGKLMIGAYTGVQYADMWAVLGDGDYGEQFRHQQPPGMKQTLTEDIERIQTLLMENTAEYWEDQFNAHKVPAARVRTIDEALAEPQVNHRSVMQKPAQGDSGPYPTAAFSFKHDGPGLKRSPPRFAQHSTEILEEFGFSGDEIENYVQSGAIRKE